MYKKVLAPLDGSKASESGLRHLKAMAIGCQIPQVVLLRVVEPIPSSAYVAYAETGGDWLAGGDWIVKREKQDQAMSEAYLAEVAGKLKEDGISVQTDVLLGRPAEVILDYAKANDVDLIIMSTRGKSGLSRWLRGSVTGRVTRNSPVAVLTAPPKDDGGLEQDTSGE
jgi:nucleotide-binding universal stress UspA family protein